MALVLNEDQQLLKDSAQSFCQQLAPVSLLRRLRDSKDETGFDRDVWKQMVDLGWAGMAIPEAYGGYGFGYGGLGVVLEETGRTLVSSPLISTVLLAATAINELVVPRSMPTATSMYCSPPTVVRRGCCEMNRIPVITGCASN